MVSSCTPVAAYEGGVTLAIVGGAKGSCVGATTWKASASESALLRLITCAVHAAADAPTAACTTSEFLEII